MKFIHLLFLMLFSITLIGQNDFFCGREYQPYFAAGGGFLERRGSIDIEKGTYSIGKPEYPFILEKVGEKFVVKDTIGKLLLKDTFLFFKQKFDETFVVQNTHKKWGVLKMNLEPKMDIKYDDFYCDNKWCLIKEKGKWGIIDKEGNILVKSIFDQIYLMTQDLVFLEKEGEKYFFNKDSRDPISIGNACPSVPKHKNLDLLLIQDNGKQGAVNLDGKVILEPIYDNITIIKQKVSDKEFQYYLRVKKDEKVGLTDSKGQIIVTTEYKSVQHKNCPTDAKELQVEVIQDGKTHLIYKGEKVNLKYDQILNPTTLFIKYNDFNKFIFYKKLNNFGVFDLSTNKELLPPIYQEINLFEGISFLVKLDGKYGFFDPSGEATTSITYDVRPRIMDMKRYYPEPLIIVQKRGFFGYLNTKFEEITPVKYHELKGFQEGFARVMKDYKWGFINLSGEEVIPLRYDAVEPFQDGKAKVKLNGKEMKIDTNGNCVLNCN